jgi:transcriptional regulator with XRE-family HTH domain
MLMRGPDHWFVPIQFRPSEQKAVVGARFRALRAALGLQQQAVARLLNVSPQAVSGWERGTDLADPLAVARLALRFRFSTDWVWLGSLAGIPRELAEELERRRPDLVLGGDANALPPPDWDKISPGQAVS